MVGPVGWVVGAVGAVEREVVLVGLVRVVNPVRRVVGRAVGAVGRVVGAVVPVGMVRAVGPV